VAKDPQAKSIFSRNMTQAIYLIDQARFVLYQGDVDKARKVINGVMVNPTDLARLPEAHLAQASG